MLGLLFSWKSFLLIAIVFFSIICFRPFCRFLCPLGAIYSLFSRLNLVGVSVKEDDCTHCGICTATCLLDVRKVGDEECIQCGKCLPVCPSHAIYYHGPFSGIDDPVPSLRKEKEEPHNA